MFTFSHAIDLRSLAQTVNIHYIHHQYRKCYIIQLLIYLYPHPSSTYYIYKHLQKVRQITKKQIVKFITYNLTASIKTTVATSFSCIVSRNYRTMNIMQIFMFTQNMYIQIFINTG